MEDIKELEQRVKESERLYNNSALNRQCTKSQAAGKTVLEVSKDSYCVVVAFTDGTYMYFVADRDEDLGEVIAETFPSRDIIEREGLGDADLLDRLKRDRQALTATRDKSQHMAKMKELVKTIGKENILRLLKEIP